MKVSISITVRGHIPYSLSLETCRCMRTGGKLFQWVWKQWDEKTFIMGSFHLPWLWFFWHYPK